MSTNEKKPVNPKGPGVTKFVTDPKEDKWLKENIIPKLLKSE